MHMTYACANLINLLPCSRLSEQGSHPSTQPAATISQFYGVDVKGISLYEIGLTQEVSRAVIDTLVGLGFAGEKSRRDIHWPNYVEYLILTSVVFTGNFTINSLVTHFLIRA
jgi:hypothetical protein